MFDIREILCDMFDFRLIVDARFGFQLESTGGAVLAVGLPERSGREARGWSGRAVGAVGTVGRSGRHRGGSAGGMRRGGMVAGEDGCGSPELSYPSTR